MSSVALKRKKSLLIIGLSIIIFSIVAGICFASNKAFVAGYTLLSVVLISAYIGIKKYRDAQSIWWIPLFLTSIYFFNYFAFNLCISEPILGRVIGIICCFTPAVSVLLFPVKRKSAMHLAKYYLALPTILIALTSTLLLCTPLERIERVYQRGQSTYKVIYYPRGKFDDSESLVLWKTQMLFPGYEKRKRIQSAYAECGSITKQTFRENGVSVRYQYYEMDHSVEFVIPSH